MCPAQSTLLSVRRLIALLEAASVRDATENGGNELRVVYIAKPKEQRVLLTKIDV